MVLNKLTGRRWPVFLTVLVALVAVALMLGPASQAPARAAGPSNVNAAVYDTANQDNGFVAVIIQSTGDTDATAAAVEAAGGTVSQQYHIIPAVEATIPVDQLDALAGNTSVKSISLNSNIEMTGRGPRDRNNWTSLLAGGTPTPTPTPAPKAGPDKKAARAPKVGPGTKAAPAPKATPAPKAAAGPKGTHQDRASILGSRLPDGKQRGDYTDVVSVFPQVVGATDVWDEGVTGKGIGVAVIDTGVSHAVGSDFGGRVVARYTPNDTALAGVRDPYGHGTHTAGVIAGNGADSQGRYMGIAPDANIVDVQVGTFEKGIELGDVLAGLEYVLDNQAKYNIRVANMSFTQSTPESFFTSPLDAAIEQLWFHGIVVVSSEGNLGTSDAFATDHPPANDPYVISVGAFSDNATLETTDDTLASWSTYGTTHDGFQKPDLVAPGWHLIATTGNKPSLLYLQNPKLRVGEHYMMLSGTSESAPVVSGTVALMLQHNPSLTPDQVKAQLTGTADTFPSSNAPALNAYDAVFGPSQGAANQGLPKSLWIGSDGSIQNKPASPDSITWDSITWDSITWDSITWDAITWDSITWDSITWDAITWDAITWD